MVDANILVSGSVWPRWPYEVLQHGLRGDFQLVLNQYVIEEARRTLLKRFPQHIEKFDFFLEVSQYELTSAPAKEQVLAHQNLVRDVTDVPVALAAINAEVDYLVSEDKDLTTQDETTAVLRSHINVLISGTFLRTVMGWNSEQLEQARGRNWRDLPGARNE
ncbi:MAG TPA: PIN domain-containing protein [Chloroflexi bacterium]|nr:PIN domain-containing protein [Chloroflexota bacterium]